MSDRIKLKSARFRVIIGDVDLPDTWQEYEVQSLGRDQTRAEALIARMKIGQIQQFQIQLADMTAWAALVRTEQISLTWREFADTYLEVTGTETDEDTEVVPTPAGTRSRLIIEIARAWGTTPGAWADEDDETIATALEILEREAEQMKEARRGR